MSQIWTPMRKIAESTFGAFGHGAFGKRAEAFAKFFGTPTFLIGQTVFVVAWIAVNVIAVANRWDPYPFILLNLMFSLQAAYAAPLILLAQARQADRDKLLAESDSSQRESIARITIKNQAEVLEISRQLVIAIDGNKAILDELRQLTTELHQKA